jgi:flavin reductase (DIM6/NTAB) family NADH-FMN oxidoreductase RutF
MLSNGVYILTSRSGDCFGGATVTWVSQASFRPPLLMAAIRPESSVFRCLAESRRAVLHILSADQVEVAQRFFKPTRVEGDRMNGEPFRPGKTEAPILDSALAYVECAVRAVHDGMGDHTVVILEVLEAELRRPGRPMTIAESPWEYGG